MSLAELWQLFPIVLAPWSPLWEVRAKEEIQNLSALLAEYSPTISHIGSTAIPGILAKPIIDILVKVEPASARQRIKELMETDGYICMSETECRFSFNKGYTPEGYADRVFHIHLFVVACL